MTTKESHSGSGASAVPSHGRAGARPARRSRLTPQQLENRTAYLFLLPWFAGLALVTLGPVLVSLYLSFTRYNILKPPRWIGLENYIDMFTDDPHFWAAVRVTFFYVGWSVPLVLVASLVIATLLNRGLSGFAIYRSIFYVPSLIGGSVAIGLLWREVFGSQGIFNRLLGLFGIVGQSWVATPATAAWTLVSLHVWTFGSAMVIFLAALQSVDKSLYEAAAIDGAGKWATFRHITLPLITPVIFFNLIMQMVQAFQEFNGPYVITGGGPLEVHLPAAPLHLRQGLQELRDGLRVGDRLGALRHHHPADRGRVLVVEEVGLLRRRQEELTP